MKKKLPVWRYAAAAILLVVVLVLVFTQGYNKWWGPLPHNCDEYKGGLCVHTACEQGMVLFEKGICYDVHGDPETLEVCCLRR